MAEDGKKGEPLGLLIYTARLEKGLSRAEVSRLTGISDNSLIRYEKAGVERDGQYPPGPKLAKLCFCLEIDPQVILLACLENKDEYWSSHWNAFRQVDSHPSVQWLNHQYTQALRDCNLMRSALEFLIPLAEQHVQSLTDSQRWLLSELRKGTSDHEEFALGMLENGFYHIQVSEDIHLPSDASDELNIDMATSLTRFRIADEVRQKKRISSKGVLELPWSTLLARIATRLSDTDINAIIGRLRSMLEARKELRNRAKDPKYGSEPS